MFLGSKNSVEPFKVMFTLYRNHSIDGRFKSVDCFLYDGEMSLFLLLTETYFSPGNYLFNFIHRKHRNNLPNMLNVSNKISEWCRLYGSRVYVELSQQINLMFLLIATII